MAKIIQCRHTFQITRPECRTCNGQKRSCPDYDAQMDEADLIDKIVERAAGFVNGHNETIHNLQDLEESKL